MADLQGDAMSDSSPTLDDRIDSLRLILASCGFDVRAWRSKRLYLHSYGRDIKAWLEPGSVQPGLPADGWRLFVTSTWRASRQNGLRCKGVKHAILRDLFAAGLISAPPPERWQDVVLDAPLSEKAAIRRYESGCKLVSCEAMRFPQRRARDPYGELRAMHGSD